jgi:ABC-type polysaccharide/polyol phosphate transport system ATPase subunit
MGAILEIANRVMWLNHGLAKMEGESKEVVDAYKTTMETEGEAE